MMRTAAETLGAAQAAQVGPYTMMVRGRFTERDALHLGLSDALEMTLSRILRSDPDVSASVARWARQMATTIQGYTTWSEIRQYVWRSLHDPQEVADDPSSTMVGTESDLHDLLTLPERRAYDLRSTRREAERFEDEEGTLRRARARIEVLEGLRGHVGADEGARRLFRKIYYTYKLCEALLGQVGYYNGSLELKAGMAQHFEYWMYLIQMKLRRPDRQRLFPAPKAFEAYRTHEDPLIPWNNQFTFSYGFDEFGLRRMPRFVSSTIERRLVETALREPGWERLCALLGWDRSDPALVRERERMRDEFVLTRRSGEEVLAVPGDVDLEAMGFRRICVPAIVESVGGREVPLKAFFTLVLGVTWSDQAFAGEANPFREAVAGERLEAISLGWSDIKDPRLPRRGSWPAASLAAARNHYHVVGKKANVLLDPRSVADDFRQKLDRLEPSDLDALYSNVPAALRTVDSIVDQAVSSVQAWHGRVETTRRPIYTGPSGHVVSYINIYLDHLRAKPDAERARLPNLEQARLVLLAGLIGFNQHHTYDEIMTASHGLSFADERLEYRDTAGYGDVLDSTDAVGAMVARRLLAAVPDIERAAQEKQVSALALSGAVDEWRDALRGAA